LFDGGDQSFGIAVEVAGGLAPFGQLRSPDRTKLLIHPGLLARYNRIEVLANLAADIGRSDGIFGLWVLVPADDTATRPSLNHRAIPLGSDAQHVRLNKAWLANKHRA
jgi:hypothetical protein